MTALRQTNSPGERGAAGKRRRGPNASTPARRAQIVRAALESFAQHGYERASLRDIASRAQITHAALLRHFSGKDELLVAALAQRDEDEEKLATQIRASGTAGASVLSEVLRGEFDNPDYQRNWMAFAIAATNSAHPAHDFFIERRERLRAHLASDSLPTAQDSADLSAEEKVTLVLAMIDGLRIQSLLDPSREVLRLLEVFMRSVIVPGDNESAPSAPHSNRAGYDPGRATAGPTTPSTL
ncbi:TetR/AcrR family transcriptional regulator [Nocardia jiangxiensis]|uniref:TetR/AcrR family transcriptional regulator n=1 Tax=Nocardia jiangxiensis TaxID=282685 RepID=UPI0002F66BEE|nr:TetR/AcrR family transcriptional regulator [Nocardia jiangxiensis]